MWPTQLLLVLLALYGLIITDAHVQFAFPTSRTDSDYQYTFDGTCQNDSCDAFCGESASTPAVTTVSPGPLKLTISVNILHSPFKYRVSFSNGPDSGFDTNILLDDIPNPNGSRGSFDVTVNIPDAACNPTCTLHLYDYYYFVSCANIMIKNSAVPGSRPFVSSASKAQTSNETPLSDRKAPVISQQEQKDSVSITAEVTLPKKSWLSVGVSLTGGMVGSRAVVGGIAGISETNEFHLGGKRQMLVNPVAGGSRAAAKSAFAYTAVPTVENLYIHRITVTFPKKILGMGNVCEMKIIWAHADLEGRSPSTRFMYHGKNKGVFGTVVCENMNAAASALPFSDAPKDTGDTSTSNDSETCDDYPATWYDSSSKNVDCEGYAEFHCPDMGERFKNFGYTAQQACCACGGGRKRQSPSSRPDRNQTPSKLHAPLKVTSSTAILELPKVEKPVLAQKEEEKVVVVRAEVILPSQSWFAVGLSPSGKMVGSRAVVGGIDGQSEPSEYDLNGKFIEQVNVIAARGAAISSSFEIIKDGSGYKHSLGIAFPKTADGIGDICGMSLMWAHSDLKNPSTQLGYHGLEGKGVFGKVECEIEKSSNVENLDSSALSATNEQQRPRPLFDSTEQGPENEKMQSFPLSETTSPKNPPPLLIPTETMKLPQTAHPIRKPTSGINSSVRGNGENQSKQWCGPLRLHGEELCMAVNKRINTFVKFKRCDGAERQQWYAENGQLKNRDLGGEYCLKVTYTRRRRLYMGKCDNTSPRTAWAKWNGDHHHIRWGISERCIDICRSCRNGAHMRRCSVYRDGDQKFEETPFLW